MDKLYLTLRLGISSLLLHKLRSALAVLGILIGVTAVIWLVALGEGVSRQAQKEIQQLGATNIIIRSVKPTSDSSSQEGSRVLVYGLLRLDLELIRTNVPAARSVVPLRDIRREVRQGSRTMEAKLVGCTEEYRGLNHLHVVRGRFLSSRDLSVADNVAVLGYETAEKLFPHHDAVGKTIQVGHEFYTVVGTMDYRTPSASIGGSLEGREYNKDVYIPLSTFRQRIGDTVITATTGSMEGEHVELNQITVRVDEIDEVDETARIIHRLLAQTHDPRSPDYVVVVPKELLRQAALMRTLFNVLLVVIAGISLVVGGIGIMNIMLATVTERTREIGIRRALGARRRDIIRQFLAETVVLAGIGGVLGVLCGCLCGPVVAGLKTLFEKLLPEQWSALPASIQGLEPQIAGWSVLVAFGISVAVGVLFGIYPARRAARMDPIEALRHE